jgi:hypothetical protein
VTLGRPYMQQHRVWQSNPAAFQLAVQLLAAAQPQLIATGLWVCESMMRRDDGSRCGKPSLLACMTDPRCCCHPSHGQYSQHVWLRVAKPPQAPCMLMHEAASLSSLLLNLRCHPGTSHNCSSTARCCWASRCSGWSWTQCCASLRPYRRQEQQQQPHHRRHHHLLDPATGAAALRRLGRQQQQQGQAASCW